MNRYDVEDELRDFFEYIKIAADDGKGLNIRLTKERCYLIREAIKHESYITVNLEGIEK